MTDITRSGPREYDEPMKQRVLSAFYRLTRPGKAVQVDELAEASCVPGRTVRQIMVDADGLHFLLGGGDEGYNVAEWREDAEALTARLESQAHSLLQRAERRRCFGDKLQERQSGLFA